MDTPSISFAALTDVGRKREHNEDNFLVDKKLSLFVVCDGMGGHAAGEVASAVAVRTLHEELKNEEELLQDYCADKKGAARVSKREILNMLEFSVNRASNRVHQEAAADAERRGMGTTLVAVLFLGNQAFIVHVGDSRLYLVRHGVLEQLTDDHNVHNELAKRKKLTKDQIAELAPKNAITRAVGVYESCEPDTLVMDVVAGDRFLLCSDGLSEYFEAPQGTPQELCSLLERPEAEESVQALIDTANRRGGKDNITAVIVTVGDAGTADVEQAHRLELKKKTLAQMPLFSSLDDRELRRLLQVTEEQHFDAGQPIIREGERGDALYIVMSGEISVSRAGSEVKRLFAGEHVGEMALIRNQPRSADVDAVTPSELLTVRRAEFFELLRTQPRIAVKLLWQFTGVLADRLAETTRALGAAQEELALEIEPEEVTYELFGTDEEPDSDRRTIRIPPTPSSEPPAASSVPGSQPTPFPPIPVPPTDASPPSSAATLRAEAATSVAEQALAATSATQKTAAEPGLMAASPEAVAAARTEAAGSIATMGSAAAGAVATDKLPAK